MQKQDIDRGHREGGRVTDTEAKIVSDGQTLEYYSENDKPTGTMSRTYSQIFGQ